jgi:hypothetical protein
VQTWATRRVRLHVRPEGDVVVIHDWLGGVIGEREKEKTRARTVRDSPRTAAN